MDPNTSSKIDDIVKTKSEISSSDNITVFIGFSLMTLGIANGIYDIPDAFIIGASLAGFCFTAADLLTLYWPNKIAVTMMTGTGVYSFFLLPVSLLMDPNQKIHDILNAMSDASTFIALGLVMVSIGVKSIKAKKGYAKLTAEVLEELVTKNDLVIDELKVFVKDAKDQQDELIKVRDAVKKELEEMSKEDPPN